MNEFVYSFQLKSVYRTNSFLYYLKRFPLIRHFIADDVYASKGIKTFAKCLAFLYELFTLFIWKLLYLVMIFALPSVMLEMDISQEISLHIFFFLTLIGGILNTSLMNPTKDKYYAVVLMRMNAKKTALSEFFYFQIRNLVGMSIAVFLMQKLVPLNLWACISMPILVVAVKFIFGALLLKKSQKEVYNENKTDFSKLMLCILFLALAFVPPFFSMSFSLYGYLAACLVMVLLTVYPICYLLKYDGYTSLYKKLLTADNIIFDNSQMKKQTQKAFTDKIEYETVATSKTGYAYFNYLFVERHKKLLTKTANRIALASAAFLGGVLITVILLEPVKTAVNENLVSLLPFSLYIMYLINRGESITKALFINCDSAMLHYRFYRRPHAVLEMFKQRLQSLILINLRPAGVIAIGLMLLLFASGSSSNALDYIVLPVTILCLSIFFSVHYLVLYYLLQPYNSEVEMKNPFYQVITGLTYVVCYAFMHQIDSHYFGVWVIGLTAVYILIALILAYRLSPKTFKLK